MSEKLDKTGLQHAWTRIKNYIDTLLGTKQNTLVSGTNIKTVDSKNILGSGNLETNNTWQANTRGQEGYVTAGGSFPNCIWRTDNNGAPSWGTIEKQEWTKDYPTLGDASHSVVQNDVENNDASGNYAHAEGLGTEASGNNCHAEGWGTTASGTNCHAEGRDTLSSGGASHAEGRDTTATAAQSHAEGANCNATGDFSHAEGRYTNASSQSAHSEGQSTTASAGQAHAEGYATTASGNQSHAEGHSTSAAAQISHAQGHLCSTTGNACVGAHAGGVNSHTANSFATAQGGACLAGARSQFVCGEGNVAETTSNYTKGNSVFIVGNGYSEFNDGVPRPSAAQRSNAMTVNWNGVVTATQFDNTSDERLKEGFEELDIADAFMEINPLSFAWKEKKPNGGDNMSNDGNRHFGMKAQDMEAIIEKYGLTDYALVKEASDGFLTINYIELIPWLIKMVQEQQTVIAELKERIEG